VRGCVPKAVSLGVAASEHRGDISDEAFVVRFAGEVVAEHARVDVLVNNTGIVLLLLRNLLLLRIFGGCWK
jgi:NAD(P)-dependent dehydrogenase (short-subunit alcohol dehydrogenase family)